METPEAPPVASTASSSSNMLPHSSSNEERSLASPGNSIVPTTTTTTMTSTLIGTPSNNNNTETNNNNEIIQLRLRLAETEAASIKKDAAIKTMQTKAKEYVAALDVKWRTRLEEVQAQHLLELQELKQQQSSSSAAAAAAAAVETTSAASSELLERTRSERESLRIALSRATADLSILREQLSIAQTEREAAMTVAHGEKQRADTADVAREQAAKEAREMRAKLEASHATHAAAVAEIQTTVEKLRAEVQSARKVEVDLRNQLSSSLALAEDRGFELATALSARESADTRLHTAERLVSTLQSNLAQATAEARAAVREAEAARHEADSFKSAASMATTREGNARAYTEEANARALKAEAALRTERAEWSTVCVRLEEGLATRSAEKDRLAAEVARLGRGADEHVVEIRKLKANVSDAEATSIAARNAVAAAEARARDAIAQLSSLQALSRTTDNVSGKLRSDHAAAQDEITRFRTEVDTLSTDLNSSKAREGELSAMLLDVQRRCAELQGELAGHKARADAADARASTASREALDHQRKRLEAKTELVSVAQALERERAALQTLSSTLVGNMIPKLTALCGGLTNLCATLDPVYSREHRASSSSFGGGGGGGGGNNDMIGNSALENSFHNNNYNNELDSSGEWGSGGASTSDMSRDRRFAMQLKKSLEAGDSAAAAGSPAAALIHRVNGLLDNAQTSTYTATRAAVSVVRQVQSSNSSGNNNSNNSYSSNTTSGGIDTDGDPEPPRGALALFLTSCLLNLSPAPNNNNNTNSGARRTAGSAGQNNHNTQVTGPLGPSSARTRDSSARRGSGDGGQMMGMRTPSTGSAGNGVGMRSIFGSGVAILDSAQSDKGGRGGGGGSNSSDYHPDGGRNMRSLSDAALESVALALDDSGASFGLGRNNNGRGGGR